MRISHEIALRLLDPERSLRVNVPLERACALDDYDAAQNLIEPGARAARVLYPDLIRRFFSSAATRGRERKIAVRTPRSSDPSRSHS